MQVSRGAPVKLIPKFLDTLEPLLTSQGGKLFTWVSGYKFIKTPHNFQLFGRWLLKLCLFE